MEHHRLKPMDPDYDQKLFNDLFKKTEPLRKKLAFQIDSRKFGVDYDEVKSWFDVKFIHAFNKYHKKEKERLLGYIISSLTTYKYRIMRSSYQAKYDSHASTLDITELYHEADIIDDNEETSVRHNNMERVMAFMKDHLSNDALFILELELSPPGFIKEQMDDLGKKEGSKIPVEIIADYLGKEDSTSTKEYIRELRLEIKHVTSLAKKFFSSNKDLTLA